MNGFAPFMQNNYLCTSNKNDWYVIQEGTPARDADLSGDVGDAAHGASD